MSLWVSVTVCMSVNPYVCVCVWVCMIIPLRNIEQPLPPRNLMNPKYVVTMGTQRVALSCGWMSERGNSITWYKPHTNRTQARMTCTHDTQAHTKCTHVSTYGTCDKSSENILKIKEHFPDNFRSKVMRFAQIIIIKVTLGTLNYIRPNNYHQGDLRNAKLSTVAQSGGKPQHF